MSLDVQPPKVDTLGTVALATWWQRVAAFVLDLALAFVAAWLVAVATTRPDVRSLPGGGVAVTWSRGTISAVALIVILITAYFTFLNGSRRGQTPGKALAGIAVRDAQTGGQLGAAKALARSATMIVFLALSGLAFLVDGAWPLFDRRRQALHDKVVGSVVVRVR